MKCECGRYLTKQSKSLSEVYEVEAKCIHCLSEVVNVTYQELIDRYMGIYDCRTCAQNKKRDEIRRKLLGLGG